MLDGGMLNAMLMTSMSANSHDWGSISFAIGCARGSDGRTRAKAKVEET